MRTIVLFLTALLLVAHPCAAAPAHIPGSHVEVSQSGGTTLTSPTFSSTAGNLVTVKIGWTFHNADITSVVNADAESFTCNFPIEPTASLTMEFCWRWNVAGDASDAITVSFNNAISVAQMAVDEYSGMDITSGVLDTGGGSMPTGTGSASGSTATTPSFNTSNADDVIEIFGYWPGSATATGTASTDYIVTTNGSGNATFMVSAYRIVSATQSGVTAAVVSATGGPWGIYGAAFKAAAGGDPVRPSCFGLLGVSCP